MLNLRNYPRSEQQLENSIMPISCNFAGESVPPINLGGITAPFRLKGWETWDIFITYIIPLHIKKVKGFPYRKFRKISKATCKFSLNLIPFLSQTRQFKHNTVTKNCSILFYCTQKYLNICTGNPLNP